jgi:hypothetical protein
VKWGKLARMPLIELWVHPAAIELPSVRCLLLKGATALSQRTEDHPFTSGNVVIRGDGVRSVNRHPRSSPFA